MEYMFKNSLIKNYWAWLILLYDLCSAILSWFLIVELRRDSNHYSYSNFNLEILALIVAFLLALKLNRAYASVWRSFSNEDIVKIVFSVILGSCLFFAILFVINRLDSIPRSNVIFFPCLTILIMLAGRYFYRVVLMMRHAELRHVVFFRKRKIAFQSTILMLGAGQGGELFLSESHAVGFKKQVIAILDDDQYLWGKSLRSIPIVGGIDLLKDQDALDRIMPDEVIIAIPSLSRARLKEITQLCQMRSLKVSILPSLMSLTEGHKITDLKEVSIEDLLGREVVRINDEALNHAYCDEVVMITGGGGSIGSELARQFLVYTKIKHLVIVDHSEYNLYEIQRELSPKYQNVSFLLGNITDKALISHYIQSQEVSIIFHAAAYKHVPMLENQIDQAINNNIMSTKNLYDLANECSIKKMVLVSTDKAVNPTNIMGATKRIAEYILHQGQVQTSLEKCSFISTRFGNVLGSAGSVIPLFKEQLKKGGPLTVTDPNMERYFMTIPEAAQLVILAGAIGEGRETFVLDMGKPVKIVNLAEQLIELSGKVPYEEIAIEFTGLRPGEKMYEELFYENEHLIETQYEKLMRSNSVSVDSDELNVLLTNLKNSAIPAIEKKALLFDWIRKYAE